MDQMTDLERERERIICHQQCISETSLTLATHVSIEC